ncbi:MAG: bifunctional phosphopantothenoylcysteine decarboxylase/phosphopantothenate--cysteine ligase CoaBC [Bacteroidetes bacterium]|nr:MAG: bifunctional phosphopantothenoylcysteine decarboxylase/phosphopantothenate--cysteine ligase CoaBC [Bacteroidota bacterium]
MNRLKNKKILLGVCGSIAAYKSAILVRLLVKEGAIVRVVMTQTAKDFITPLTLSTLSKNAVEQEFYNPETGEWANHVELGLWADVFLIAPATANEIAKMANGLCDNLLSAIYLSARCAVVFCPAMDVDMYKHQSVKTNLQKLQSVGNFVFEAEHGELASGLVGVGRMAEPEHIIENLVLNFTEKQTFAGKKVLITAGPTQEALDPVRYISNHSSGKMGIAIAQSFAKKGGIVTLVVGKIDLNLVEKHDNLHVISISSADEMYQVCKTYFDTTSIAVFAAAVADYKPKQIATNKIKKNEESFVIELTKNIDIAFEFGKIKKENQLSIGFALETDNELENAQAKLAKKNFDLVVLNSMQDAGATFGHDTNKITIISKHNPPKTFDLKSKNKVAEDVVNEIEKI